MVDIDQFKNFNDTVGDSEGDAVLKVVVSEFELTIRSEDIVFRHGGEEFKVVTPETGFNDGIKLGDRLQHMIETTTPSVMMPYKE